MSDRLKHKRSKSIIWNHRGKSRGDKLRDNYQLGLQNQKIKVKDIDKKITNSKEKKVKK